ncbi:MAG: TlpA family protein disulfide reductase [Pirellulales bacterium]
MRRVFGLCLTLLLLNGCAKSSAPAPSANSASGAAGVAVESAAPAETTATSAATAPAQGDGNIELAIHVELAILDYQGIQDRIAQQRGKVVVMDAWSTSCPPCMKEFHNLVDLHKQYGPDKVACISLSFDYEGLGKPEEQSPRLLEFLRSQGATFTNLMSSEESDVLYRKFDLAAVPAVFVYDQAGQLRKRFDNQQAKSKEEAFTYEQVKALVAELLAAEGKAAGTGSAPAESRQAAE